MTTQPLLQFGTVVLNPAPDGRVVRFQAVLAEQPFDIGFSLNPCPRKPGAP